VSNSGQPVFTSINCLTTLSGYNQSNSWGAVASYPFNGNANDTSGNGFNGTIHNATLATDRNGNANACYFFTGYNSGNPDYIELPNYSNFETSGEISISLWCKMDNVGQSPFLFTLTPDNPYDRVCGTYFWNSSTNYSPIWDHGNIYSTGRLYSSSMITPPTVGTWCHLVFVRSKSSNFMNIYYNGIQIASTSNTTDIVNKNLPLRIGGGGYQSGQYNGYFIGYIDDFKIFNRALNSIEINQIYNSER